MLWHGFVLKNDRYLFYVFDKLSENGLKIIYALEFFALWNSEIVIINFTFLLVD